MKLKKNFILLLFFLPAVICSQMAYEANAGAIQDLIDNGGYAVTKEGRLIAESNLHEKYIPASIIKIATSLAALHILGPQYRFETLLYFDKDQNLYIKGYGDPYLTSEEVSHIVSALKKNGCERINNIYLDDTEFSLSGSADGAGFSDNPYDAQNSGLAVNFNTVNINKDTAGRVFSAEEQTPTLPIMTMLANGLKPGIHRVNINYNGESREIISRYTGELFRAFQQIENIPGSGSVSRRKTPSHLSVYYSHSSRKTLKEIIAPLMLYSNNFIANQLFLAVGAAQFGYPATWEKGRLAMKNFLQNNMNVPTDDIRINEGSGLSRKNLVSPHAMIRLLDKFKPFGELLPEDGDRLIKSGTLKGVYAYAGYFKKGEQLDSFVLILNQEGNNRDRILSLLEKIYRE